MSNNTITFDTELKWAIGSAILAAVTAIIAHGRWPYHYYETFRWIICLASLYSAYCLRSRPLALAACVGVAIVFNPIAPLRMRASQWQQYDIGAAIVMGIVATYSWRLLEQRKGTSSTS